MSPFNKYSYIRVNTSISITCVHIAQIWSGFNDIRCGSDRCVFRWRLDVLHSYFCYCGLLQLNHPLLEVPQELKEGSREGLVDGVLRQPALDEQNHNQTQIHLFGRNCITMQIYWSTLGLTLRLQWAAIVWATYVDDLFCNDIII